MHRRVPLLLLLALVMVMGAACDPESGPPALVEQEEEPVPQENLEASLTVGDQTSDGGAVLVDTVLVTNTAGFLVLHADDGGEPGAVLGTEPVGQGSSFDVVLPADAPLETGTYHVVVYGDAGVEGQFEPDVDRPVRVDGEVVQRTIEVTVDS